MIVEEIFYGVKCNRCKEVYEDGEHSYWSDADSAIENATESEWIEQKGKHYCTNCYDIKEDTDEIIVLPEYSKELKTLVKYCEVIGYAVTIRDTETHFVINLHLSYRGELNEAETNYIKSLVTDKFDSIIYDSSKYNSQNKKCTISVFKTQ